MAEETINRAIKAGILENEKCVTRTFRFYDNGTMLKSDRLKIYGDNAPEIEKLINDQPFLAEVIDTRLPYTKAEIVWICRNEMPRTLEDMLARRTRSLFLDARASTAASVEVADIMAEELGFDETWKEEQVNEYRKLAANYL
jgi:glycerol-3-phosphate dehydrogenase